MGDGASFVPCSIHIKNFDRFFQCRLFDLEFSCVILIDEFTFSAWVYQGVHFDFWYLWLLISMVMDNACRNFKQFIINMTMYYRASAVNIQSRRNCRRPSSPQIKSCSFGPFLSSSSSAMSKRVSCSSVVSRDCHRFDKPAGKCRGLTWGAGMGWICPTLAIPVPAEGLAGWSEI